MKKKGANIIISLPLKLSKALQGGQIQVQTCFGPLEINFLISVILGMALLVTRCVCMYVCGVDGFRGLWSVAKFHISLSLCMGF